MFYPSRRNIYFTVIRLRSVAQQHLVVPPFLDSPTAFGVGGRSYHGRAARGPAAVADATNFKSQTSNYTFAVLLEVLGLLFG